MNKAHSFIRNIATAIGFLLKPIILLFSLSFTMLGIASAAPGIHALPTGGKVSAGAASISQTSHVMTINQSTNRAAVNWNTFNVGSQATVNIKQPNSSSVLLNRVNAANPSQIFGQINANGQVFLTNPSGIYFAPGSSLNVGGLVATTHSMTDAAFMAGSNVFNRNGATGSVINEGTLTASLKGYIALLAPEVRNNGIIVAQLGTVALAAGETFELQFNSNNTLANIRVDPATIDALVSNGNAVHAPGGLIILSAQAINTLQGGVVNNSGQLAATGLTSKGGVIRLNASNTILTSGTLDVHSNLAKGGHIQVTGKHITVDNTARLIATGASGGGDILVGGSWQNSNPSIDQAITTTIKSGALLDASATDQGNGGMIVAWSDITNPNSHTLAYGNLWAKGGKNGGNGGQIETSGYNVDFTGIKLEAFAPAGHGGKWLIDPFTGTHITQTVADTYSGILNTGVDVIHAAASDLVLDTSVNLAKTAGLDATLTLKAARNIILSSNSIIQSVSNKLNVVLWSDSNNNGAGAIQVQNSAKINSNGGNITLSGGASLTTGFANDDGSLQNQGIRLDALSDINAQGGNIILRGTTASWDFSYGIDQKGTVQTSGNGTIDYLGRSTNTTQPFPYGIFLHNQALVQSQSGTITMIGTANTSSTGAGISMENSPQIVSTSGNIDIRSSIVKSGDISRITMNDTSKISSTSGNISLTTDSLNFGATTSQLQSSGSLTIKPYSAIRIVITPDSAISGLRLAPSLFTTNFVNGFSDIILNSPSRGVLVIVPLTVQDPLTLITGVVSNSLYNVLIDFNGIVTTNNNNLTISSASGSEIKSQINIGNASLIKEGTGTLMVRASIAGSGGRVDINKGLLSINANNLLPNDVALTVASGATFSLYDPNGFGSGNQTIGSLLGAGNVVLSGLNLTTGNTGSTFSGVISGAGNLIKQGNGNFSLTGNNTYTGTTTINGGGLILGTNAATGTLGSGNIINNAFLQLGGNSYYSLANVISGTGNVFKADLNTVQLTASNTYTGTTTVGNGILRLGANNVFSNSTAITVNSTLDLNSYTDTIGSLAGAGSVTLGSGTLSTGANGTDTTFSGVMSGTGNLIKTGFGTFTLSGNNTYSGTTTLSSLGTLQVGAGGTSGTLGSGNVTNNSILDFNRSDAITVANGISGTGLIRKHGNAALTLSGNNSYSGSTTIYAGTLLAASNTALGGTSAGGSTSVRSGATLDLNNVTIGAELINLFGTGILSASSGTSSLSGDVFLSSSNGSKINVASGAQLTLSGKVTQDINTYYNFEKTGLGTLILTGNNNNYWQTTVSTGTLQVGNGGTTGKLGIGPVIDNANLFFNHSNNINLSSLSGSILGTGSLTAQTDGSLTIDKTIGLTGANSKIALAAGYNTAAGTASGGDVSLSSAISTSSTGTISLFSGNVHTAALAAKITGATGVTKYKKYNSNSGNLSGASAGTRNFYYRQNPTLTISGLTATKTYDGSASAVGFASGGTISGAVDGDSYLMTDLTNTALTFSDKNVGSKTLNASYTVNSIANNGWQTTGYGINAFSGPGAGTINAKTITLSGAKIYDGNTSLTNAVNLTTGVLSETLAYSGATANDSHVGTANKYMNGITLLDGLNGGLASNYQLPTLNPANAAVTITAKTLTPTISNTGISKLYDATTAAPVSFVPTYTYTGFVSGDTDASLTHSTNLFDSAHAASATKITVAGLAIATVTGNNSSLASDYVLDATSKFVNAMITPVTLTSTISNTGVTKVYDGTTGAPAGFTPAYNVTGFIANDSAATLSNTGTVYDSAHVANASKITVSGLAITGITGSNGSVSTDYGLDASSKNIAATITVKNLTATIASPLNPSKTYDATTTSSIAPLYSYGGALVAGDTAAALTHISAVYNTKDVATANTITVSGLNLAGITGNKGSQVTDYALTNTTANVAAQITPKTVTLSATKVYDGTTSLPSVSLATGITGETLAYSGATAVSAHVASPANFINAITLVDKGAVLASNYTLPAALSNTSAPVIITPALLTPTISNTGVTKVYDGTNANSLTPTYTYAGLVTGDSAATLSNTGTAYDSAHVANASKITVSGLAITGITGSNLSERTDYVLDANNKNVAATITAKNLTATIASPLSPSKIYDATTTSSITPSYTYGGALVAGDTAAALTHISAVYNTKDVTTANTITVSGLNIAGITGNKGSQVTDYALTNTTANVAAQITPKTVTLSATKVYDGTTSLPSVSLATGITGETLAYSGATAVSAHVTSPANFINAITLVDNGAALASNYTKPTLNHTSAPVTITPALLTSTISNTGVTKIYDGTSASSLTPTYTYAGLVTGDTAATLSNTGTAYNSAHVANASKVTVSGLAITGITGNNTSQITDYVLDATNKYVASTITPATLTPSISNIGVSKIYDGTRKAPSTFTPSYTYTGFVGGDSNAILTHTSKLYDSKNVASASKISVSGLGIAAITGSNDSQSSDYTLMSSMLNVSAKISKKIVTLAASKIYDGMTNLMNSITISTGVAGELLAYSHANASDANVATSNKYISSITLLNNGSASINNYKLPTLNALNAPATILPKGLSVTANNVSKYFDGVAYHGGNGVMFNGFVNGESAVDLAGSLSYVGRSQGVSLPGSYSIKPQGLSSYNYVMTYIDGALHIQYAAPIPPPPFIGLKPQGSSLIFSSSVISSSVESMPNLGGNGVIIVTVPKGTATSGSGFSFALPTELRKMIQESKSFVDVKRLSGDSLPHWITFDAQSSTFNVSAVPGSSFPMQVVLTLGNQLFTIIISERDEDN